MRTSLIPILLSSTLFMAGCSDALVGKWESTDAWPGCSGAEGEFEIEDNDLQGSGSVTLSDGNVCFDCRFDIEATEKGDDEYELRLDFEDCTIDGSTRFEMDCTIEDDTLECDDDYAPYDEWERDE